MVKVVLFSNIIDIFNFDHSSYFLKNIIQFNMVYFIAKNTLTMTYNFPLFVYFLNTPFVFKYKLWLNFFHTFNGSSY